MSLLAALAATVTGTPVDPDPDPGPGPGVDTTPYAMPTSAPWNVPTYTITPTPDGTGSVLHPSVQDFGPSGWNGYRYWMGVTPLYLGNDQVEDPCVLCSHDGFTWRVPPGMTNPLDTTPPGGPGVGLNSDTELFYDEPNGRLYLFWRSNTVGNSEVLSHRYSTDGHTWSPELQVASSTDQTLLVSPSVQKIGSTYYIWTQNRRMSASTLDGPFGAGTFPGVGGVATGWAGQGGATIPGSKWHISCEVVGSEVWALVLYNSPYALFAAKSTDGGENFIVNPTPVIAPSVSGWDNASDEGIYRGTFQLHENGTHVRLWYSGRSPNNAISWRVAYTQVPRTVWTSIT